MSSLSPVMSQRISLMKLICAFMVAVVHSQLANVNIVNYWVREGVMYGLCRVAVPFFFLSSGYFLSRHISDEDWWSNAVVKRIKGLLIPCVAFNTLFLGLVTVLGLLDGSFVFSFSRFVSDLGLDLRRTPALSQLWYIRALLVLIFLSPLILNFLARVKKRAALALVFSIALVCFVCRPFSDSGNSNLYFLFNYGISIEGLLYFAIGAFFYFHPVRLPTLFIGWIALVLGLLGFLLRVVLLIGHHPEIANRIGFLAIPLVMLGLFRALPPVRLPSFFSAASYPVYLFHFAILAFIGGRFAHSGTWGAAPDSSISHWAIRILVAFTVSLAFAAALRRLTPRFAAWLFGGR